MNSLVAVLFFYFFGDFVAATITPKTNLFINLPISFLLIWGWRIYIFNRWAIGKKLAVSFICAGPEVDELKAAITKQERYRLALVNANPALVVFDKYNAPAELQQNFGRWLFRGVRFITVQELYEEIFERVPLSLLDDRWFLEQTGHYPKPLYDFGKRLMDVILGLVLGILSLPVYPFVWLAIKWEDGGPVFFRQPRVGKNQKVFQILKFRSMRDGRVMRVGEWIRRWRLDELPQLWSVVAGEQSLIGPRPERPDYAAQYQTEIPYYDLRHLLSPGLSGWAQLYQENHPHHHPEVDLTREKLSYDLYYLKHRGLWLDIKIALKTLKTLLSRTGI
jgi:lipopolysaccharide/colanic/teichoic acid biosynthesis glycosyltransferase